MKIVVNGQENFLECSLPLLDFLQLKNINPQNIVIEHNYAIVKRDGWSEIILQENDNLEILAFVGGG